MKEIDDVFNWIKKVIDTCQFDFHFDCADKLIELYYLRFNDMEKKDALISYRNERWHFTHNIMF